jgi:predicted ferric reductase
VIENHFQFHKFLSYLSFLIYELRLFLEIGDSFSIKLNFPALTAVSFPHRKQQASKEVKPEEAKINERTKKYLKSN